MTFIKVVKNKAYFKRFQVKFRRRREGNTDYRARKRLIAQDKTKYNAPKYRFVVRITLKDIVAQVVAPKIKGDEVICVAYAHELPNYGLKVGLTNYAAAYCTGLLCARRLLHKFKLDKKYAGNAKVDGTSYLVEEPKSGPKPFRAALDVGLAKTTTGARVFGILKGACDGGLYIPHSGEGKRFPGYGKDGKYDPKVHRAKIFGQHVADYMKKMKTEDAKKYAAHFANFIKEKVEPEALPKLYEKVHSNIRADPTLKKKVPKKIDAKDIKKRPAKKSLAKRRQDLKSKKEALVKEISKKRAESGMVVAEEESGEVKLSKKDKVKQISTKKPKAPKEKGAGAGKDAKGGKAGAKDAKGGAAKATDAKKPAAKK